MFKSDLVTFLHLFENLKNEYNKANIALENRINELNSPQGYYEDAALQTEREDLINQLAVNEQEQNQIITIMAILKQTISLIESEDLKKLAQNSDYRILRETLSGEIFNPKAIRQADIDQKAAAIFEAVNALEKVQAKLHKEVT